MTENLIAITTYVLASALFLYSAFLYWYAYIKANKNEILGSVAILLTACFFDILYFTFGFAIDYLREVDLVIIPKFIILVALLNLIRASFKKP